MEPADRLELEALRDAKLESDYDVYPLSTFKLAQVEARVLLDLDDRLRRLEWDKVAPL